MPRKRTSIHLPRPEVTTAPLVKLLVSVEEAAKMLGTSRATLYPKIMRGDIRSIRDGARRKIPVSELEAYVQRLLESQVA